MEILINSTSIGNIIITAGSVILLLVLIKLFAWEQLTGVFTAREEKIANDIDGAEAARKEAEALAAKRQEELAGARTEAAQIIDDAKETGKNQEIKIVAEAHEEASRLKAKANQDIEQSKAEALSSVKGDVADLTVLLAEKIMTANLDKEAQSNLIDSYLDKLGDA
ncbi:F0F1 ATP synthase subunit B [Streptococcus lutetiensis]|uniref:F0F1 ATP synthase subunit B n=1 Tax=Streptococcus lutetiensis TaxID=150055 RepID=UPI000DA2E97D|nr:F0F1 ATP synthase subunit B [Streptococcus lutetiensis]QQT07234.1 F0F1 ATP synthase subunit B [Streptococcus lutetiensis]SQG56214.1 F-type H+-transporting ATPase subunit b [Streptococcus lutetiensis]VTT04903.1 F-type H+-transporting ATPase subunit b [Streptococcus lutetiensis]